MQAELHYANLKLCKTIISTAEAEAEAEVRSEISNPIPSTPIHL